MNENFDIFYLMKIEIYEKKTIFINAVRGVHKKMCNSKVANFEAKYFKENRRCEAF